MKFKIDENIPVQVARLLSDAGHDAVTVVDPSMGGASDRLVMDACRTEERVLITLDVGFADIRAYPPAAGPGVIVLRLHRQEATRIVEVARRLIPAVAADSPERALWVVEESRIRVRE